MTDIDGLSARISSIENKFYIAGAIAVFFGLSGAAVTKWVSDLQSTVSETSEIIQTGLTQIEEQKNSAIKSINDAANGALDNELKELQVLGEPQIVPVSAFQANPSIFKVTHPGLVLVMNSGSGYGDSLGEVLVRPADGSYLPRVGYYDDTPPDDRGSSKILVVQKDDRVVSWSSTKNEKGETHMSILYFPMLMPE